jgi:hypothetical protein
VSTVVQRWQVWPLVGRKHRYTRTQDSRRPRRTTDRQVRYLIFLTFHISTRSVATAWYNVTARLISMPAIYGQIRSWSLYSYHPHLVLPLTLSSKSRLVP